jgi:hypothetical protein
LPLAKIRDKRKGQTISTASINYVDYPNP